ncbi:hypothetical protein BCR33DRAFT_373468 [Rhizoclosmatium globosum]|uniref:TIR domain-containing protein n=1 Tax=Rhizoclosmatium globosum TaxID=329046 RepID=A0A1Y2BZP5_9FUNG|nr:hypothetical protein BCR33DRAFT_373468 [Rhizoclosmatium globosum]|eukprot:ORY40252.1 hypothetical protein BCR33DRAFT_373468 [Rhizoclosmatium globosum]
MADEENKKQFHIFISYRVNTDADLAEKLCDKLQALTILNEQREVRIKCFLDKQNLKEGVDYTSQFMTALTGSCLVLPIVSEACLKSMLNLQAGWTDNVLKEWQTALHFQSMDKLTIIPILVGANEVVGGSKVYRKFEGFTMVGQLPDLVLPDAINDHTVKQVIGNLFKLQGIFLNPLELTDKLAVIQSRFSSEVWPSYRTLWSNVAELGPEPQLTCVQCLQPYTESSNGDGACRFHLTDGPIQEYGRTYACCQLKDPLLGCHRNRHNPKHHNRFKYGSFVNWRAGIMWNTLMSRTHAKISADDYSEEYADETAWIRVGATTSNAGKDQNKLMIASAIPYESWFMLFEKEELIGVDTRLPVFSLKGQRDEYAIGRWIVSDEGHEVIGINIECGTRTSVSPSSVKVHFAWPEINDFNGPEATLIEFCKSAAFGERPLPKALQNIKNPYNLPTTPLVKVSRQSLES